MLAVKLVFSRHAVPYFCVAGFYLVISSTLGRWNPYDWNKHRVRFVQVESFHQGWGDIGIKTTADGAPITINDIPYHEAIGTHAHSRIEVSLKAKGETFSGICGYPDVYKSGTVECKIFDEDKEVFASKPLNKAYRAEAFSLKVPASRRFVLEVRTLNPSNHQAHAAWTNFELQ
jgi:hypothetical protein